MNDKAMGFFAVRRGTEHPNASLDERKVQLIRKWLERGVKQKVLARRMGVSQMTISRIARKSNWSHVE